MRLPPVRMGTLVGAAAGIAGITALARAVGFGRIAVFGQTVGASCLGDTYTAANSLPNILFEVVAGGALASLVVPLVAGAVASGDRDAAGRTTSALLTWTLLILTPLTLLAMLAAPLLVRLVLGDSSCGPAQLEVATRMLLVFAPQILLYGVGVVLVGVLQAHRRFLGPALAPLLSSLVVITAYLLYAARGRTDLAGLTREQELILSVGTTLGVVVLTLSLLVPLRRCGLQLRPGLTFPAGVAPRLRTLAAAGAAALVAQQLALLVALRLAGGGDPGSVVVFTFATALFLLPWGVLAVPLATSAYPSLSALADQGRDDDYAAVASRTLRAILIVSAGSAAVLAAVAVPAARVLVQGAQGPDRVSELAAATAAFAPGLLGYGVLALLTRALYARGDGRTPATASVVGWLGVALTDIVLISAAPGLARVTALGVGNTVGLTAAGALLVVGLHRGAGPAAVTGAARATGAAVTGALLGAAAGTVVSRVVGRLGDAGEAGILANLLLAALAAVVVVAVYAPVVRLLDPAGLQALTRG